MEYVVGLLFWTALIFFVLYAWAGIAGVLLPFIVAAIYFGLKKYREAEEERERARKAKEASRLAAQRNAQAQRDAHAATQASIHGKIMETRKSVTGRFIEMPQNLLAAEKLLDEAENEFEERAFSPYWKKIEDALIALGRIDEAADSIGRSAGRYLELSRSYEGKTDDFPVVAADTARVKRAAAATQLRLNGIIRKAHTDFQFSTIYEQRKTNAILIRGFSNLGEALNGLSRQLEESFDAVNSRLSELDKGFERRHDQLVALQNELVDATATVAKTIGEAARSAERQRSQIAGAQAEMATEQLAMLDNIQRRRKPGPDERGPRSI